MTVGDKEVEGVKNGRGLNDSVVVELAEILENGDAALIFPRVALLQPHPDFLQHRVDEVDNKLFMVAIEARDHVRHMVDIDILDLPDFEEAGEDKSIDLGVVPGKLADPLDNVLHSLPVEINGEHFPKIFLDWVPLLHHCGWLVRWIGLERGERGCCVFPSKEICETMEGQTYSIEGVFDQHDMPVVQMEHIFLPHHDFQEVGGPFVCGRGPEQKSPTSLQES